MCVVCVYMCGSRGKNTTHTMNIYIYREREKKLLFLSEIKSKKEYIRNVEIFKLYDISLRFNEVWILFSLPLRFSPVLFVCVRIFIFSFYVFINFLGITVCKEERVFEEGKKIIWYLLSSITFWNLRFITFNCVTISVWRRHFVIIIIFHMKRIFNIIESSLFHHIHMLTFFDDFRVSFFFLECSFFW